MSVIRLIWLDNQREGQVCSPPPLGSLSAPRADSGIIYQLPLPFPASPPPQRANHTSQQPITGQEPPAPAGTWLFRKLRWGPECHGGVLERCQSCQFTPQACLGWTWTCQQKFRLLPKDAMALCLSLLICKIEMLTAYTSESATLYSENFHRKMWGTESAFSRNSPHTNSDYFYSYFEIRSKPIPESSYLVNSQSGKVVILATTLGFNKTKCVLKPTGLDLNHSSGLQYIT